MGENTTPNIGHVVTQDRFSTQMTQLLSRSFKLQIFKIPRLFTFSLNYPFITPAKELSAYSSL
jgi:hypothetical protein